MSRQKHVYPTSEIAHLWAHQRQSSARNKQGNFYFHGDTIYSYGSHFPIAKIVTHDGRTAVLMTTRRYSNTTAKHLHQVRGAITHMRVFHVYSPREPHEEVLKDYQSRITSGIETTLKAKANKLAELSGVVNLVREANEYSQFFRLGWRLALPDGFDLEGQMRLGEELRDKAAAAQAKRDANRSEKWKRLRERQAAEEAKELAEYPEKLLAWLDGTLSEFPRRPGGGYYQETYRLRIRGGRLQSSGGAVVSLKEAKALLPLLDDPLLTPPEKVGGFGPVTLDHDRKVLSIGCHRIAFAEIRRAEAELMLRTAPAGLTDHPDFRALFDQYRVSPEDTAPLKVAADWLQDHDCPEKLTVRLRQLAK
jgi:hypothetical protein